MARLTAGVLVRHPGTGDVEFLATGTELPDWAASLVGDHVLDAPLDRAAEHDGDMPDLDELDPDDPSRVAGSDGPVPPPRSGKGSGQPAWLAYAREQGVNVDPDADRADIIAALDDADVPTG